MIILPIRLISEVDKQIFGLNLYNLSQLQRSGLPVPNGVVIGDVEIILQTVLKHLKTVDKEIFEQKLSIIKGDLSKICIPVELEEVLEKQKEYFLNGKFYKKAKDVWIALLNLWLEEIRSRLWRGGFEVGISSNLFAWPIFFLEKEVEEFESYFDPGFFEVIIKQRNGKKVNLEPKKLQRIDRIVLEVNQKLFLPQVCSVLTCKDQIFLTGVTPFTQTLPVSQEADIILPKKEEKRLIKSAVKVFFNLSSGFAISSNMDGILIEGEKINDFETMVFKLSEAALTIPENPVIFRLPTKYEEEISGSLRLINHKGLLDEYTKAFLFVRHKKDLSNLELAIPLTRSVEEFLQIKRDLASLGIHRKGSLKIWLEVCVPENIINLEKYLEVGLDGIILNLDSLQQYLGGHSQPEREYYKKEIEALLKFITTSFKLLHKEKIPILAQGELVLNSDVLDFLLEQGVWGIVANNHLEGESLPEHLNWSERRMVVKKLG